MVISRLPASANGARDCAPRVISGVKRFLRHATRASSGPAPFFDNYGYAKQVETSRDQVKSITVSGRVSAAEVVFNVDLAVHD